MADSVELIRASTRLHIREVETGANSLGDGRGSHLRTLLLHGVKQFDRTFVQIDRELDAVTSGEMDDGVRAKLRATVAQKFERLGVQLHLAYTLLNTFSASIGRADVPIGLQHLLGTVLSELVSEPSDPIVHPNPIRMYSTKDLVDRLDELLLPYRGSKLSDGYAGPHPIVFNLPALDPSNALLSPIIAHEVGHTAVERKLRADLRARVDADVQAILSKHLASAGSAVSGPLADTWANLFRQWCSELICDAVALVSAGPAFMLAFASFAQPTASPTVGTHPPVRDRIALQQASGPVRRDAARPPGAAGVHAGHGEQRRRGEVRRAAPRAGLRASDPGGLTALRNRRGLRYDTDHHSGGTHRAERSRDGGRGSFARAHGQPGVPGC